MSAEPFSAVPTVAVHGGAGSWMRNRTEVAVACQKAVTDALDVLQAGGAALDAVQVAVKALEDAAVCNAGTGAVLTDAGTLELDACIMDGSTYRSGAVGALSPFLHPIDVARAVLTDGRYHLLVGAGAATFARESGFVDALPETMITDARRNDYLADRASSATGTAGGTGNTVGAVALDGAGRLAAATSTGGVAGKHVGRLGDTPIVGAGTYATESAACSCTGDGEAFARACAAYWAVSNAEPDAQAAADAAIARVEQHFGGRGGLILLDRAGGVGISRTMGAMPYAIGRPGTPLTLGF